MKAERLSRSQEWQTCQALSTLTCDYVASLLQPQLEACLFLQSSLFGPEGLAKPPRKRFSVVWFAPAKHTYFISFLNPSTAFKWREGCPVPYRNSESRGREASQFIYGAGWIKQWPGENTEKS